MSMWPTNITTMASLFVLSNPLNTMGIPSTPKPQYMNIMAKALHPAPFTDWSSDDNCKGTKQKEKEKNK